VCFWYYNVVGTWLAVEKASHWFKYQYFVSPRNTNGEQRLAGMAGRGAEDYEISIKVIICTPAVDNYTLVTTGTTSYVSELGLHGCFVGMRIRGPLSVTVERWHTVGSIFRTVGRSSEMLQSVGGSEVLRC
jgi:hypothetical protein